jgi:fumarate reductase (CoM/CoB) subunit A
VPAIYMTEEIHCDVLVIGAGAAGSCAAAAALDRGATVCVAVKGYFAHIGMRGSGASACGNTEGGKPRLPDIPELNYQPEQMVENAIKAGLGMADRKLVYALAQRSEDTRKDLEAWGCSFFTNGAAGLGYVFIRAVEKKIRSMAIILEHTMVYELLLQEGECVGALGFDSKGRHYTIHAKAVVIATGGNAQLFSHNVHPSCCTADGYAMALRAGASLMNLEFMQIFTATVAPTRNLVHTWRTEQLEHLYNRDHQHFLEDYLPPGISAQSCREENVRHAPFSTRDNASRYLGVGIVKEILAGRGTDNGGVYLDLRTSAHLMKPSALEFMRYKGIPIEEKPLEITMAHQCSNGGIQVGLDAMTSIPGLFAAGEAITGTHGADRIGANMLAQCAIFGRTAGIEAVGFASKLKGAVRKYTQAINTPLVEGNPLPREEVLSYLKELKATAWANGLVVRNKLGLEKWLAFMDGADERLFLQSTDSSAEEIITRLELRNLLLVGKAVCHSELGREESRGPHYREDFPELDSSTQPAASVVSFQGENRLLISKQVVDSEWSDTEALSFGNMRWG